MASRAMVRQGDGTLRPTVYADLVTRDVSKQSNGLHWQIEAAAKRKVKQRAR